MKRVVFEQLRRLTEFDVDVREVHEKSSKINIVNLKENESVEIPAWDFQTHIAVLEGRVAIIIEDKEEIFQRGCLASILPMQKITVKSLETSRLLMVRDDPLWVLRERRSVRKYASVPVSKEIIEKILDFSRFAPSAGNLQPWRIYLINDEKLKRELAEASFGQDHVAEASWVVVITMVPEESASKYGDRGRHLYSIQDTAALALYIMLTSKAYGLDTCWVGAFDNDRVWKIIGSPSGERPVVIIPIGYGEEFPETPYRKSLGRILREI